MGEGAQTGATHTAQSILRPFKWSAYESEVSWRGRAPLAWSCRAGAGLQKTGVARCFWRLASELEAASTHRRITWILCAFRSAEDAGLEATPRGRHATDDENATEIEASVGKGLKKEGARTSRGKDRREITRHAWTRCALGACACAVAEVGGATRRPLQWRRRRRRKTKWRAPARSPRGAAAASATLLRRVQQQRRRCRREKCTSGPWPDHEHCWALSNHQCRLLTLLLWCHQ
jgi:hypothetical protein